MTQLGAISRLMPLLVFVSSILLRNMSYGCSLSDMNLIVESDHEGTNWTSLTLLLSILRSPRYYTRIYVCIFQLQKRNHNRHKRMYGSNEKKDILKFMAYDEDIIFNKILKLTLICCNLSRFSAMEWNLVFQRSLHIMRYSYNLTSYI